MKLLGWPVVHHDWCPFINRRRDTEMVTWRQDGHTKPESDIGLMWPHTKEHLGLQKLEEAR